MLFLKSVAEDLRNKDYYIVKRLKCIELRMSSFFIGMV
jgi:hypothetical protein